MAKKIFVVLLTVVVIFGVRSISFATSCHGGSTEEGVHKHSSHDEKAKTTAKIDQKSEQKPVNMGNKICPVSGEKIVEKTKATYEYKGKVYNFCCAMCLDEFKKNPEKYIEKVEEELSESGEETPIKTKEESHQGHHHP